MVRLDRITMFGFKSFANKTTIPFQSGFNVVAGPNGSGKSNVIDAMTFVLGTRSARAIRAQKLQNLLFNGARDRKPAEYCEVSLYIDNSDGSIRGYEKEIKITRKVSRSGVTVYRLNGKTVTRSKILDMLANANLSPEGYNIIMQGDVTKIIEMNPQERRHIIDDISGISEFDEKKEKSTKELERVEIRVRENMIIVAEKQRLVERLKKEKEVTEKYEKLSNELKTHKASLIKKKINYAEEKINAITKDVDIHTKIFNERETQFKNLEKDLEKRIKVKIEPRDDIEGKHLDVLRTIDTIRNEIIRKKDRIDLNEREIQRIELADKSMAVREIINANFPGVYGVVSSLIKVPAQYATALNVALGRHTQDIIVSTDDVAVQCIKYLKQRKIGRVRFIPLNRIRSERRKEFKGKEKIIGYAIDLIQFDRKYQLAMEHILKTTLVVDNIDTAKKIPNFRVVTLDGDLTEMSGVMIGGFFKKTAKGDILHRVQKENELLMKEINVLEQKLENFKKQENEYASQVKKKKEEITKEEKNVEDMRTEWKNILEERMSIQNKINKLRIEKARIEANYDNLKVEMDEYKDVKEFIDSSSDILQEKIRTYLIEINRLGPVNMKAMDEFNILNVEFEELKKKLDKLLEEKEAVSKIILEVDKKRVEKFMETFNEISDNFTKIYKDAAGGEGILRLEAEGNIDSGLIIEANPSGKKVVNLDTMSGGEKTLTSLAFLFAVMQHYASPFYVLDEVDAALDKANTQKIAKLVKKYSKKLQFIIITHNDLTIAKADKVFGVSMENGISKVFGIELPKDVSTEE